MKNGRTDMSYNISQVPMSNVDKIVPKALERYQGCSTQIEAIIVVSFARRQHKLPFKHYTCAISE
jgi:hypothetical protein